MVLLIQRIHNETIQWIPTEEDIIWIDSLHNQVRDIEEDVKLAKEYCEDHERIYGSKCTPKWCKECGHLHIYEIIVTDKSRKMTPKFDRKKRK